MQVLAQVLVQERELQRVLELALEPEEQSRHHNQERQ